MSEKEGLGLQSRGPYSKVAYLAGQGEMAFNPTLLAFPVTSTRPEAFVQPTYPEGFHANPHEINWRGFSPAQTRWIWARLMDIGLPTANILTAEYRPNDYGRESVLASWTPVDGRLTLRKSLERLPAESQGGQSQQRALVHEIAHEASPFQAENVQFYGSVEAMEATQRHVEAVARQTHLTKRYMSGYHRYLHEKHLRGEISWARFREETHAIMTALRFTNPQHLAQVEAAQQKRLENLRTQATMRGEEFTDEFVGITQGVNQTLINLLLNVNDVAGLDLHVERVRMAFRQKISPLSETERILPPGDPSYPALFPSFGHLLARRLMDHSGPVPVAA